MENNLLIGLSRQVALQRQMNVIANNLANMQTSGYKAEKLKFEEMIMPVAKDTDKQVKINAERIQFWIERGAQCSDTVNDILAREGVIDAEAWKAKREARLVKRKKQIAEQKQAEEAAKKAEAEAAAKAAAEEAAAKKAAEEAAAAEAAAAEAEAPAEEAADES